MANIPIKDFSRGLDNFSARSNIKEGYSEGLLNVDVSPAGYIETRKGYQGYCGYIPVRVVSVEHDGADIIFTLDSSIDLTTAVKGPIVVYGKLSSAQTDGDFTNTPTGVYYPEWTIGGSNNKLVVADITEDEVDYTDASPQLTIWGLGNIAGYAQHVDVFRRPLEERVITGASGHFYSAKTRVEVGNEYLMGSYGFLGNLKVLNAWELARFFDVPATAVPGSICKDASIVDNAATIVSVAFRPADGFFTEDCMVYTVSFDNWTGSTPAGASLQMVQVSGLPHAPLNGTFRIVATRDPTGGASNTAYELFIQPENAVAARWNTAGCQGKALVMSATVAIDSNVGIANDQHYIIENDQLLFDSNDATLTAHYFDSKTAFVSGLPAAGVQLADNDDVYIRRTSDVVPLSGVSSLNIVPGDMLSVSGIQRQLRVKYVNPYTTQVAADLEGDGTTTIITISSTAGLNVGQKLLLLWTTGTGVLHGIFPITSIQSATKFTVASSYNNTPINYFNGLTVVGNTLQLDEEIEMEGGSAPTTFSVVGRWVPVEAPEHGLLTTPKTLPAANAATRVRSVMAQDNMYLTSYTDDVVKFDGTSAYNAGLPRWRPHLFAGLDDSVEAIPLSSPRVELLRPKNASFTDASVDTGADTITATDHGFVTGDTVRLTTSGTLPTGVTTGTTYYIIRMSEDTLRLATTLAAALTGSRIDLTAAGAGASILTAIGLSYIMVPANASATLREGNKIRHSATSETYTVLGVSETTTHDLIYLDRALDVEWSMAHHVQSIDIFKYYVRLNAVDANSNIIASAVTASEDLAVELTKAGQIRLRLVGMPTFGNFDYSRIELEVYRTKANTAGPFYLVCRQPVPFTASTGYIDIVDSRPDVSLFEYDVVNNALLGAELGTTWDMPPQAKHVTAVENTLVLANITDKQRINLNLRRAASAAALTASTFNGMTIKLRPTVGSDTGAITYQFVSAMGPLGSEVDTGFRFKAHDGTSFLVAIPGGATGTAGKWIYISAGGFTGFTLTSTKLIGWYYVDSVIDSTWARVIGSDLPALSSFDTATDVNPGTDTITIAAHGFTSGESCQFHGSALPGGIFTGTYEISVVDANSFQLYQNGVLVDITSTGTGTVGITRRPRSMPVYCVGPLAVGVVPVYLGPDMNMSAAPYLNPLTDEGYERLAAIRLAAAINATQRVVSGGHWLAEAGGEFAAGECNISVPYAESVLGSVVLGTVPAGLDVYVGGVLRESAAEVSAVQRLFPSRVVKSYPNFPEIYDNPYGSPTISDSAIDVGAVDGQEITGVMPFFGASTSGGSQLGGTVVVFKTASIYLVDVASKQVQRIPGNIGCTAPRSIVATPSGIMFVNESGVYMLTQDMKIRPVGRFIQTFWRKRVSKVALSEACGTYYALRRQYKLSIPVDGEAENSYVLVYNQEKEGDGQEYGAWTFYNNHPATGWANLADDAVFSTTDGQVFSLRKLEEASDYRDDGEAVATQEIILRAEDFGAPGLRKRIRNFFLELDGSLTGLANLVVKLAADLSSTFVTAGTVGELGDEEGLRFATPVPKAKYAQLQISHSGKDKCLVLTGVSYNVDGLTSKGTTEEADV